MEKNKNMSMLDREFSKDTFIDIDEYKECYYFSKRNPCYRAIRDSIIKHLFAEGIKSLNDDIHPTSVFHEVLNKHWVKFGKDVLDSFLTFGFAVYEFLPVNVHIDSTSDSTSDGSNGTSKRKRRKRKVLVPHVPVYNSYKIKVKLSRKTKRVSLHFYDADDVFLNEEKKDLKYLVFENSIPDPSTGKLYSKIACLLKHSTISNQMTRFTLQSEYIRSRPTIFTKSEKESNKKLSNDDDFYNSITAVESLSEKNMIRKNENVFLNKDIVNQQNEYANRKTETTISSSDFKMNFKAQWEDNIFHLPNGTEMASSTNNVGSSNSMSYRYYEESLEKYVHSIIGIPYGIFSGGSSIRDTNKVSVKNSMDLLMLRKTFGSFQNTIETMLNEVYVELYGNDEDFQIGLTVTPFVDQNEILMLHEQGVITTKQKSEMLIKSAGLPTEHVLDEEISGVKLPDVNTILLLYREGAIDDETKIRLLLETAGVEHMVDVKRNNNGRIKQSKKDVDKKDVDKKDVDKKDVDKENEI
jgi:hypothetical protein